MEYRLSYQFEIGAVQVYTAQTIVNEEFSSPESYWKTTQSCLAAITRMVWQVDGKGNALINAYTDTHSLDADDEPLPVPPRSVVYLRMTPLGEIVECTDPLFKVGLTFPKHNVSACRPWIVTEEVPCEGCLRPVCIVSTYAIAEEQGHRLLVSVTTPRIDFEDDVDKGSRHTIARTGEYLFSLKSGCIVSSRVLTAFTTKSEESTRKMETESILTIQGASVESSLAPPG